MNNLQLGSFFGSIDSRCFLSRNKIRKASPLIDQPFTVGHFVEILIKHFMWGFKNTNESLLFSKKLILVGYQRTQNRHLNLCIFLLGEKCQILGRFAGRSYTKRGLVQNIMLEENQRFPSTPGAWKPQFSVVGEHQAECQKRWIKSCSKPVLYRSDILCFADHLS